MTTTMNTEFCLADVVVGSTVLRGKSTAGYMVTGTVSRVMPGIGFRVVQESGQRSILWTDLAVVPDATPVLVVSSPTGIDGIPAAPALARTDSGADYGILGFPDCAFWERNGVNPLYLATSDHYDSVSGTAPGWRVKQLLQQHRCEEADGPFRRAWDAQMAAAELAIANTPLYNTNPVIDFMEPPLSPPRRPCSPSTPFRQIAAPVATPPVATPPARMQPAVCPGAPGRAARKISEAASDGVPTLVIPDVSDHKGAGILPGDFIKPDPLMTQQETRRYILAELERFLTGRVQRHALQLDAITPAGLLTEEMETLVSAGRWPAARLFTLFAASPSKKHRQDPEIHMDFVARVALESCVKYLNGALDGSARATGFVTTDLLPNGRTIASYWDHSPFEGLRKAAPLPAGEAENLPLPKSPLLRQIAAPTPPFGATAVLSPDMSPIGENTGLKLTVYEGKTYFLNEETGLVYSLRQGGMEQVAVKEGEMFVFLEESEDSESEAETTDGEESEDEEYEVSDSEDEEDSDGDSAASEEDDTDGEGSEEDSDSDYVPADGVDADGHVEGWGGTLRPDRLQTLRPLPHRVAAPPAGPQGIDERIDSRIDAWTATFGRFVQTKYTFTISGGNILSVWFAITVYLWIINFMLAGRR
jgi:hypothetical protein